MVEVELVWIVVACAYFTGVIGGWVFHCIATRDTKEK